MAVEACALSCLDAEKAEGVAASQLERVQDRLETDAAQLAVIVRLVAPVRHQKTAEDNALFFLD